MNGLLSWSSVAQEEKWQLLEQFLIFLPLETNAMLAVDFALRQKSSLTELGTDCCNVFLQRVHDPEMYPKLMAFSENAKYWQLSFQTFCGLLLVKWMWQRADTIFLVFLFLSLVWGKERSVEVYMVCLYKKNGRRQNPYLRSQNNTINIIKYFQSRVYKAKNLDL